MLTAYNKVDAQSKQAQAGATTKPRPQKPGGLKGTALRVKEVPLTWQANPEKDVSLYFIYRAAGDSDSFANVGQAGALYTRTRI